MSNRPGPETGGDRDPIRLALRGLSDVQPPPSLVPAVMKRVSEPAPLGWWGWLWTRRKLELRVSPLGALAVFGTAAVALIMVARPPGTPHRSPVATVVAPSGGSEQAPSEVVLVRFVLNAKGARRVAVAGDFNGWDAQATVLEPVDTNGTFVASLPLRRGAYEYMFIVDGQWLTDPAAAERRPDGFGRVNGVLRL